MSVKYFDKVERVRLKQLEEHPDNPNEMTGEKLSLLVSEIKDSSFKGAIFTRDHPEGKEVDGLPMHQILDGEHRWKALFRAVGEDPEAEIPIFNLPDIDDKEAQYLVFQFNSLKGELNPVKIAVWLENLRKMDTADDVYKRTRIASRRQQRILERLAPVTAQTEDEDIREGYTVFSVVLTDSEYESVMRALRMTRLYAIDTELLRICEEFMGCKLREKIQEEMSKSILKELDEGKSLVEVSEHFASCDDAREALKAEVLERYKK